MKKYLIYLNLLPPIDIVHDFTDLNVSKYPHKRKLSHQLDQIALLVFSGINYNCPLSFCC